MSYALVKAVSDNSLKPGIGKRFSDFANDMVGRADGYVDAMDDSFIKKALKVGMGTDANTQRGIKEKIADIYEMRGQSRMAGREFAAQHPGIVRAIVLFIVRPPLYTSHHVYSLPCAYDHLICPIYDS